MVDGDPYVQASAVQELAARDAPELLTLPSYSPELNPVEECWRQRKASLSDRYFDSLPELTTALDDRLAQSSVPKVGNYF